MVLFGQMESASNLTSVVSMAEGLQWATLQIKAPFRIVGDQASKQELFIGNLFWLSLILCCVAIHAVVTIHYVDRLPIILCFPAIEIFMMQMGFGSITTAAAVVLNPKEPIHWGYTVAAAAVMTAAAGWTVFVVATLWLHCSDDHTQCSYTLLSDVSESNTPPEKVHESSDCARAITETESKATSSGVQCIVSEQSVSSESSEGRHRLLDFALTMELVGLPLEESNSGLAPFSSTEISSQPIGQASAMELALAKTDAATEELLKLRTLFARTELDAEPEPFKLDAEPVVLPEMCTETEPDARIELDAEPEPFKLDAFTEDPVLKTSDAEMEPDDQQGDDDSWLACWKRSGCGKRGVWGNGSLQVEAEHSFDEMTVTYNNLAWTILSPLVTAVFVLLMVCCLFAGFTPAVADGFNQSGPRKNDLHPALEENIPCENDL